MNLNDYLKNRITKKQRTKQKHIYNPNLSLNNKYISINTSAYADNILKKHKNNKINKSCVDDKNNVKINFDNFRYQNYNTIDAPEIKNNNNFYFYNVNNPTHVNLSNYVKNSRINKKIKNERIHLVSNNNYNYRNDILNLNDEVEYMNMKINLKVLEHKLSKLTDILISDNIFIPKHKYENIINFGNIINKKNINISINDKNIKINENNLEDYYKNIVNYYLNTIIKEI